MAASSLSWIARVLRVWAAWVIEGVIFDGAPVKCGSKSFTIITFTGSTSELVLLFWMMLESEDMSQAAIRVPGPQIMIKDESWVR